MPTNFPCPNPACSAVFAPEGVNGTATFKCPRCGTVFGFRGTIDSWPAAARTACPASPPVLPRTAPVPAPRAAPPKVVAPPVAQPAVSVPVVPVAPVVPHAMPVKQAPKPDLDFGAAGDPPTK